VNLVQKNIVITGGTSGIGREVVKRLYSENRILVIARNRERLAQLAEEFPGIFTCQADLSNLTEVEAAAKVVRDQFDSLDLLINNAAIQNTPTFIDPGFSYASIQQEITVNFTAPCTLIYLLLPALMHRQQAAIVNVNSGLGLMPKTGSAVYCATKGAVNIFSQSLRYQLETTNVKVMQVFMPLVNTQMTAGRGTGKLSAGEAAEAMIDGIVKDIEEHDIGKIKALRRMIRLAPGTARRIMKKA